MAEYEIHVSRSGRWQIEGVQAQEADAIAGAKRFVAQPGVEGVKVVKDARSRFGKPTTVFEQAGRADTGVVTVGTLDAAPARCETSRDLYGGTARQTMAKLLRNYTSKANLTVGEILYNSRELKRVMEKDNLFSSAVSKVATLQSGQDQQGAKTRRDELFAMMEEVVSRADAAEKTELPSIAAVGLAALEREVASKAPDAADRDYLLRVAISRDLMDERSFIGKLGNAVNWADAVDGDTQVAALDDFIADTLTDPTVIQELLGRQDNLLTAILATLDLLEGQLVLTAAPIAAEEGAPVGERLNKLIGADRLPGAAAVISERLQSMIAGKNPLVRDAQPKEENDALRKLVERLVPMDAPVRIKPDILTALIERGARFVNKGGETGRHEAVEYIMNVLPEPARQVRFLLAVAAAYPGTPMAANVIEVAKKWIATTQAAIAFHADNKNPALVMRAATNLFYYVRDSGLPAELTGPLTEHLETLLFDYIEKAQILKMVDNPNRPLRSRARLLISMCLPDMLPPGKAVEAARVRVVNYLQQPDFTTQVVADLTEPAEKEKALRELFELMGRAGFK